MVLCCFAACDFDLPFGDDDDDEKVEDKDKDEDDDEDEDEDEDEDDNKKGSDFSDYDYEEALERVVDAKSGDFDAYWEATPEDIWDATGYDKDDLEDDFNDQMESIEDYAGEVKSVDIEIYDEEKMDDDDIEELINNINDNYYCELDASDVSKAYEFEAKISIQYEDQGSEVEGDYYAIKYDGEWYIVTEYYGFYA